MTEYKHNMPTQEINELETKAGAGTSEGGSSHKGTAPPPFPVLQWDKYEFIEYLGEGGMGRVYKARDRALGRYVALKFIRGDDEELVNRLLQEARAQAKINHENVCKIHEVGEVDSKLYIAMQYIEGKTLSEIQDQLSLEQKIIIMKQVAEGVHAAHRMGLIHRDIKPANIMMEHTEDGSWKPYVMDFGLAREQAAPGLTVTGIVIGTPHYMSPEQAKGLVRQLDRRSDIYSMGATFYSLLVGHPPFNQESSIDVLLSLLGDEPVPLRQIDPTIPVDIETIVMKCLEKEPQRRYDSARALCDDFTRYQEGEPIAGRRASVVYRLRKKAHKHKAMVVLIGIAVVVIAALAGIGLHARLQAREQAALSYQFGQEIKEMEAVLRFAYMLPLHNVNREENMLWKRIESIKKQMARIGKIGNGPGNYALGRAYLMLQQLEPSKEFLEKAWKSGYREPEAAYALGRVYGALYQDKLEGLRRISNKEQRKVELSKIQKLYREPALRFLQTGSQVRTETPAYVEALIAFYEKQWDVALKKCAEALEKVPWLYEAKQLEGDIYISMGDEKRFAGDTNPAKQDYVEAGKALHSAILMAQSDPMNYLKLCRMWNAYMEIETDSGTSQKSVFEITLKTCDDALQAKPNTALPHQQKSYAYRQWAEYLYKHGENPLEPLHRAIAEAQQAIEFNPRDESGYDSLGSAESSICEHQIARGQDPREYCLKAIASHQEALKLNPYSYSTYNNIGIAYGDIADWEMQHGMDPQKSLELSIFNYKKAIENNPNDAHAHNNIGVAYESIARYQASKGADFTESLNLAIQHYKKAFEINRAFAISLENISFDYCFQAEYEMARGLDPRESLKQAIAYAQQAHQVSGKSPFAYEGLGLAYALLFRYETGQSIYNKETMQNAIQNLTTTITMKPDLSDAYAGLIDIYLSDALFKIQRGQNPLDTFSRAKALLEKLLEINPSSAGTYIRAGKLALLEAQWRLKTHVSPEQSFNTALSSLEKALQLNPQDIEGFISMADYYRCHAQWRVLQKRDSAKDVQNGLTFIEKALRIQPAFVEALAIKKVLKGSRL